MIDSKKLELFEVTSLRCGDHATVKDGVCAMEAAAWLAGEEHSDAPACIPDSLAHFLRHWNDSYGSTPAGDRQRNKWIKPVIVPLLQARLMSHAPDLQRQLSDQIDTLLHIWVLRNCLVPYLQHIDGVDSPLALEVKQKLEATPGPEDPSGNGLGYSELLDVLGRIVFQGVEDEPGLSAPHWQKAMWRCLIEESDSLFQYLGPELLTVERRDEQAEISQAIQKLILDIVERFKYVETDPA